MAKQFTGKVISDKADKTIVVSVDTKKNHPIYRKSFIVTKKFAAHDESNEAKTGGRVRISETRPISKSKKFKLVKIIERPVLTDNKVEDK